MSQTSEAQAFLARIAQLPPGPGVTDLLSQVLQPSLDDEAQLRKLWATDKNHSRLRDPHVGLVDVFDATDDIRKTRARVVTNEADLSAHYILPLNEKRRRKDGEPSTVADLDEFKKNWAIFTEGALSQLTDWSNVVAAGGSVQACLAPVPESAKASKRAMRKYFHNNAFPTSDIDLFLYGLTPEQAEAKMQTIYEAVRDSVPWDVTCVRTKHTVSIHSQYPYRSVQIVLRLYSSPAEVLAGFDVDAPCCAFDGRRVWASPRALVAMMRQCNTVDMTRRSPSYEVRLTKYSMRDFEVYVPTLRRDDIDPTIFERSIQRVQGLARLLVLERFLDADTRQRYLVDRRKLRARPDADIDYGRRKKKLKGDLKANVDIGGLEMNDYDVVSLHIPYGTGWDARRIDKLVYQTDLGMNSPYNPKNKDRRLHRHPAFFGTLTECLEDCCEFCPEPKNDEEKKLQEKEDESYVRGRVQFIREDPGRQSMSGSFNPIDEGEWAEQAYIGPTEKLFNAIVLSDRAAVAKIVSEGGSDIDRRDHVGRTPLQVAILSKEVGIACDLVDAGARMTSRLVDGRTALHLAAQLDLPAVVRKLLERSAVNAEKAKEEEEAAKRAKEKKDDDKMEVDDEEGQSDEDKEDEDGDEDEDDGRDSSEDDWSSNDGDVKKKKKEEEKKKQPEISQIPEDEEDVPDVFDVNVTDWDYMLTPLQYAVIFGSLGAIDELLAGGADATLMTKVEGWQSKPFHPLTLTALTRDPSVAGEVAKKLVAGGATSSQADDNLFTIFHKIVCSKKPELVEAFLRHDPSAKAVIDTPFVTNGCSMTFPVVSAIGRNDFATLAVLLAYGAKYVFTEEDYSRAADLRTSRSSAFMPTLVSWQNLIQRPVESAICQFSDAVDLLVNIGAEYNVGMLLAYRQEVQAKARKTILDAVRGMLAVAKKDVENLEQEREGASEKDKFRELAESEGWKSDLGKHLLRIVEEAEANVALDANAMSHRMALGGSADQAKTRLKNLKESVEYFTKVEELLRSHGAKSWKDLHPEDTVAQDHADYFHSSFNRYGRPATNLGFFRMAGGWRFDSVPSHLVASYEELFQACRDGDNAKIEELCLPKGGKSDKQQLLQITARYGEDWGVSPLSLALQYRHWMTARLVLAIAVAQYKPPDAKAPKFNVSKVILEEDDSDNDSDEDSDMDDDEQEEVNFVDIAQRPSSVTTDTSPEKMLQLVHRHQDPRTKEKIDGCMLFKAVLDDDFEAFVQIADLYNSLPQPLPLPAIAVEWTLTYDRPTMLDELIRRSGAGIELLEESQADEEETAGPAKPQNLPPKTYLGLNVHGKKRKDLVQRSDPNAPMDLKSQEFPLLWKAAREGAIGCIRYLSSERAVGAYQYYASTHSDDRAQYLKRINAQIPQRLGWATNGLNESVVTAAVIGDKLETLKTVIDLQPAQLQSALMARLNYVGFNHILAAANWGCTPEMFDYLLSKGVSPTETDVRGWNAFHILCVHNSEKHLKLLKHILSKLPEDVAKRMLIQQSKKAGNTPLHIAVKRDSLSAVRLLLKVNAASFLLRDSNGCTPLHIAVNRSRAEITRSLGEAGPDEALTLEDGVGNTPLEISVFRWLQASTGGGWPGVLPQLSHIQEYLHSLQADRQHTIVEEVKSLRDTLDRLGAQGRLRTDTKLATELLAFAERLEVVVKRREEAKEIKDKQAEADDVEFAERSEVGDASKTLDCVVGVLASKKGLHRNLVHLLDVHHSVKGSLGRTERKPSNETGGYSLYNKDDEGGLDAEVVEDKEEEVKTHSAVSRWHYGHMFEIFGEDRF